MRPFPLVRRGIEGGGAIRETRGEWPHGASLKTMVKYGIRKHGFTNTFS